MNPFENEVIGTLLTWPQYLQQAKTTGILSSHFRDQANRAIFVWIDKNVSNGETSGDQLIAALTADPSIHDHLQHCYQLRHNIAGREPRSDLFSSFFDRIKRESITGKAKDLVADIENDATWVRLAERIADLEQFRAICEGTAHKAHKFRFTVPDLVAVPIEEETRKSTLLGNSFLPSKSGLLLIGTTGVGKSVMALQAKMHWAQGLPYLGIKPSRPIKCLYIEAEDGELDLAEMVQGCFTPDRNWNLDLIHQNLKIIKVNGLRNEPLMDLIREEHDGFKFDLVTLNPIFSYVDGDLRDAQDVSRFCRDLLDPLMESLDCSVELVGHTPKPVKTREGSVRQETEYAAFGSTEFPNWARATLELVKTTTTGVYRLIGGKRRNRIGWADEDGNTITEIFVQWAEDRLEWIPAEKPADDQPTGHRPPAIPRALYNQAVGMGPATPKAIYDRLADIYHQAGESIPVPPSSVRQFLNRNYENENGFYRKRDKGA